MASFGYGAMAHLYESWVQVSRLRIRLRFEPLTRPSFRAMKLSRLAADVNRYARISVCHHVALSSIHRGHSFAALLDATAP